jgi:two-component system, OmpR family, KDP operon response regulator KdpE
MPIDHSQLMIGTDSALRNKILIVDDDAGIRQALKVTLSLFGFDVAEASSGEQAIELAAAGSFDAVLLDMNMPGMGGVPACREIRRKFPLLPVLMLTVRDSREDREGAFEAGAGDYVTKPFHIKDLAVRVREAIVLSKKPARTYCP